MGIPWNTIQGFAGTTGIGAICILGIYFIIEKFTDDLSTELSTFKSNPEWKVLSYLSLIISAYLFGLISIYFSSYISSGFFSKSELNRIECILTVSKTKNDLLLKEFFMLEQKSRFLNGISLAILIFGIGFFIKITDFSKSVWTFIICVLATTWVSYSILCFGHEALIEAQRFVNEIKSSINDFIK